MLRLAAILYRRSIRTEFQDKFPACQKMGSSRKFEYAVTLLFAYLESYGIVITENEPRHITRAWSGLAVSGLLW
jgi:hypothetical protein